jgi:hypothetical protein
MSKQNPDRVAEDTTSVFHEGPWEGSAVNSVASAELARLRLLHPGKLTVELVDKGSTVAHGAGLIQSNPQHLRKSMFLEHLKVWTRFPGPWNSFKNVNSPRLYLISGFRGFAKSLSKPSVGRTSPRMG